MLTYRKAKELLTPGDIVYTIDGGKVIQHEVVKIHADSIVVNDGWLYFDDVAHLWWLTRRGVTDALKNWRD